MTNKIIDFVNINKEEDVANSVIQKHGSNHIKVKEIIQQFRDSRGDYGMKVERVCDLLRSKLQRD